MSDKNANIAITVDLTNPGQFFACCGLLELADRLWPGAEGWFERREFCIDTIDRTKTLSELLSEASSTTFDVGDDAETDDDDNKDENLPVEPIWLQWKDEKPAIHLDWWTDKSIKPWAGSMKERVILRAMLDKIDILKHDPFNDLKAVLYKSSENVCVLDSIPSQANRMEPLFGLPAYSSLVPQYSVKLVEDVPPMSVLNIGHRLADAVFRGTTLRDAIVAAFKDYAKGNATPIAKLGATSLVFGVWDSRGTGIKVPRLISSIVRAFNVTQLQRSVQYSPPIKYEQEGLLPSGLEGKPVDHGLADVPSTHKIGGIQVNGNIRRDFSLNQTQFRRLATIKSLIENLVGFFFPCFSLKLQLVSKDAIYLHHLL